MRGYFTRAREEGRMAERVAIVGVAQTKFVPKYTEYNYAELANEVIKKGIEGHGSGSGQGY